MIRALILTAIPAAAAGTVTTLSLEAAPGVDTDTSRVRAYGELASTVERRRLEKLPDNMAAGTVFKIPTRDDSNAEIRAAAILKSEMAGSEALCQDWVSTEEINLSNNLQNIPNNGLQRVNHKVNQRNYWASNSRKSRRYGTTVMMIDLVNKTDGHHTGKVGEISYSFNVAGGKLDGEARGWNSKGDLYSIESYREGRLEGVQEIYHPNGQLRSSVTYENGIPVGEATYYKADGSHQGTYTYENGRARSVNFRS